MLSVGILAWVLYATEGHYRGPYVWYLLFAVAAFFVRIPREKAETFWRLLAASFALVTAISPLVVYAESTAWVSVIRVGSLLFAIGLLRPGVHLPLLSAASLAAVVLASPHPFIDVWTHSTEVTDALLAGKSPYSISVSQLYKDLFSTSIFTYPPLVVAWMAPWKALLGDVRYAWIFTHVATGCLLFRASGSWGLAAAFLSFPAAPFIIEQSWIDGLSMLWGVAALLAYQRRNRAAFGICAGLFLVTKQTNLLFLPVFVALMPSSWSYAAATVALVLVPFYAWDPAGFVKGVLWPLLPNPMTGNAPLSLAPRKDALSLAAEMLRNDIRLPGWLPWLAALVIWSVTLMKRRTTETLLLAASLVYFFFFWLSAWAFCNYYWFASLGAWMALAESSRRERTAAA